MDNSEKFFANKDCKYYPCHSTSEDINCLFCFCPLYNMDCPGNYIMTEKNGKLIKNCKNCLFPHVPSNYPIIMDYLRK
ncbi:MAG: cysteine-rich small domain-containing protein [Lachnospiraceae bacterium]|nr:cysteine-rich small domain-containing protein [Lachnospiraceae bacterium]